MTKEQTQEDAIHEDVLDGDKEAPEDPRTAAINSIVDAVDKDRKVEMGLEPDSELDPEAAKEPVEPEKEPEPEKDEEPEPEKKPAEPSEEMVKIIVDGKESEVPISKIKDAGIRTFQKESAADARLEETKKLLAEIKELKESLAKPAMEIPHDKKDAADSRTNAELLEAIRYGEDEEAEAAISLLRQRSGETSVTPGDIEKMVDARLGQKSAETIWDSFQKSPEEGGYSDVVESNEALELAKVRVDQLVKAGRGSLNDWETYQEAGDWARRAVLGVESKDTPKPEPNDPENIKEKLTDLEEKRNKKRKITNINPASKTIEAKNKEEELTLEEARANAIDELRRHRGG